MLTARCSIATKIACQPLINLTALSAAANAAAGTTLSPPFEYYTNYITGLLSAFVFEDVGVTAYNGAAPLITDKTLLGAAVGIGLVEGYRAGVVSILLCSMASRMLMPLAMWALPCLCIHSNCLCVCTSSHASRAGRHAGSVATPLLLRAGETCSAFPCNFLAGHMPKMKPPVCFVGK